MTRVKFGKKGFGDYEAKSEAKVEPWLAKWLAGNGYVKILEPLEEKREVKKQTKNKSATQPDTDNQEK